VTDMSAQETTAEELESAYRSEVWHPFKGHLQQHGGLRAARVDLNSLTNEAKVHITSPVKSLCPMQRLLGLFDVKSALREGPVFNNCNGCA
jgi:hypothetical protein